MAPPDLGHLEGGHQVAVLLGSGPAGAVFPDADVLIRRELVKGFHTASQVVAEKTEAAEALNHRIENLPTANVNSAILPEIQTPRTHSRNPEVRNCLDLLEKELDDMTAGFACVLRGWYNLTTTEIRIANLIKEGLTTDEISDHLNLSPRTIGYHRNNIQKKLGPQNKRVNLQTHLLSLS